MTLRSTMILLAVIGCSACKCSADIIESVVSGHYDSNGSFIGTPTPESPTTENYSAGFIIDAGKPVDDPFKVFVRRNYFVFDLSSITSPVVSPTLVLPLGGYVSDVEMHTYLVTSSSFSAAEIADPTLVDPVAGQAEIFATMGVAGAPDQMLLGDVDIVKDEIPGLGTPPEVSISIDEAFFNTMIGGELVLTARMASDDGPTDFGPPGLAGDERIIFAFTNPNEDFVDSTLGITARPRIEFSAVPEPGSFAFLLVCGVVLYRRVRD